MMCNNEDCPWKQVAGPVECPAANNGCPYYQKPKILLYILKNDADTGKASEQDN